MDDIEKDLEKCFRNWTCLEEESRSKYNLKGKNSNRRPLDVFIDECLAKQKKNREMNDDMANSARRMMGGLRFLGFFWGKP